MKKLKYKLENEGKYLRKLIDDGDESLNTIVSIYNQMVICLKSLKLKLIGADKINLQYNIDCMVEDFQTACQK